MIWLKYVVLLLLWTSCNSKSVCEEPPEVDFGEIVSDERAEYQSSDRVQYRCFPGYALEGPEWITCKGPQWTPSPKCLAPCTITKQQLEVKNLLLSGGRRHSIVIQNNQTVEFLCREGYVLSTPSIRKCIEGHMNLPFCISVRGQNCSRPPTIRNGDITTLSQKQYTSGSSVEFKCQRYYAMEGDSRSFCDNGNWTKVPACLEPCVISLPRIERQNISVKLRSNEDKSQTLYLPRGDSIVFSCKPGHVLATDRSQSAFEFQCRGGPVVYPECEEIICASGNIVNGYVTSLKDVYKDGDELQFECHNGYKPVDRSVAVCSENGWNTRLECTEIVCSRPPVDNGRVSPHKQQYAYEETIQIQCDTHYEPERKQTTSRCTKNGWVPQPKCVSKRCSYPEVENVVVYRTYWTYRDQYFPKREGETIYFRCENGFLPENKEQWHLITCTKSGWNPEPKCFKQCEHKRGFLHGHFIYQSWQKFIEGNEISFSCDTGYHPEQQEAKAKCTKSGWSPIPRCLSKEKPNCKKDPPVNGFFVDRKHQFDLNERTNYRCHIGFTTREGLEEGETRCLHEGWTPKPECIQTCQKPIEENIIISIPKQVFLLEENLHYKCEDGYETSNKALEDHSKCTANGWSPTPQCLPIQCDILLLDNGDVQPRKDQYLYNDVVRFSCRTGHIRVGPLSAQCFHFGWSPPPPICKKNVSSCQPPSNITDGRIITALQEEYLHGQQVEYECNIKYAMTGSQKIECVDGQWTSLPSCTEERKTCGSPPRVQNAVKVYSTHTGARTNSKQYLHGETMSYKCNKGFAVSGINLAKCLHGNWKLPSCTDGCARPEIPKYTNSEALKERYNDSEVVSYTCDSSQHTTKCDKGNWSPTPDCRGPCPPPPQPPNATEIFEVRNYENGEKIQLTCKKHFLLKGQQEILCEDGKWKMPPRCIDASCGNPPPIANGRAVNGTQGRYLPETKVEYHCDEGFSIRGTFSTCINGNWTSVPTCKENPCGPPPQVFDASLARRVSQSYQPGDIVHYVCHPGFAAAEPLSVTCRKGQWTEPPTCEDAACGDPPTVANADIVSGRREVYKPDHHVQYRCHKGFEMSGSDTVTCGIMVWSEPPTCEDVRCPPPNEIEHGEIVGQPKERYLPYETVRHRCDPGWSLSGPPVVTCLKKQWTKLPRCLDLERNCGPPPHIQNGDVLDPVRAHYTPGTTLRYKCQNLYLMNGTAEVRCEDGVWTEAPICIEACTISEEDMRRNNIQLKWRNAPKLYAESGDAVEFICKWNYQPVSPPSAFRTQCIQGKVEYPRCIWR